MLTNQQKATIADNLVNLFAAFPASRAIDRRAAVFYVEDVADFTMEAVSRAIIRFRRGEVPDRNYAFAPSVAEFVAEVRERQRDLDVEAFWDKTTFVEADTAEWRALCKQRGRDMPRIDRRGIIGWYVPKDEVDELPPQLVEEQRALLEHRDPRVFELLAGLTVQSVPKVG